MSGVSDLNKLIQTMSPALQMGDFVFVSVAKEEADELSSERCVMRFSEEEGVTLILSKFDADVFGFNYDASMAWITLNVHSSLEAVGLTAAFSQALGQADISCNVVAGFYHDHIFVPKADAVKAMQVLQELSESAGRAMENNQ